MGKNQKKKEPPSWRFELHQSVDALVPVPSARGGKKGGGKRSGGGLEERAGTEKPPNGDWDQIDPAVFCELVPTLPRDLVFSVCATERAAGAPVQEALDRLLALSLREEPASSGQGSSSQPTLRVARGVSVRVPQEDAGAPVPRPPVRDGDTGSLRLWALPVEICGEICATLGGASPATLGRLAQSCTGCRALVAAWLRHDVGSAGLGLGSSHCFGVGGAVGLRTAGQYAAHRRGPHCPLPPERLGPVGRRARRAAGAAARLAAAARDRLPDARRLRRGRSGRAVGE